jgi:glycosyltransferase involved in cell wall biosynthesis
MKVLHVIPSLSRAHGGATRALELMETALLAQGVSVETASTDDAGLGQRNGKPCGVPIREGETVRWYFRRRFEFYKTSPQFARWIISEIRRHDLIHVHALFSFTPVLAAWAARRAGIPYVIEPLGTLNQYGLAHRRPRLKRLSLRFVEGPLLRDAAAVRFTSEQEAAEAGGLGLLMKAAVIPLGVELPGEPVFGARGARFAKQHAAASLLFLSRLDPKKNLEALIDALALLRDELPGLRLVIAGDGVPAYVTALKSRVTAARLQDRILWAGHLDGEAKTAAFAAADVFVLPSFSENFGIAAVEALAAGLPCVLGNGVAVAADVVHARAGLAVAADAASIADGLRRIIGDKEGLVSMSANAKQLAQARFSVDAMGLRLKQLYTDILAR